MQQPPTHGSPVPPAPAVFGGTTPYVSSIPYAHVGAPKDSADLFLETLPTPALRAATMAAIATAMVLVLMAFRLLVNVSGLVPTVVESLMLAAAAGHFAIAWGLGNGRIAAAIGTFVMVPFVLLASAFTFLTGLTATALTGEAVSLLSFIPAAAGGTLAVLETVLVAVSMGAIGRIARAKAELKRLAVA
jgi:hypothetical protein